MTTHGNKNRKLQALWQSGILLILAALMALATNQIRPRKIRLVGNWSSKAEHVSQTHRQINISLDEAREAFFGGAAVFIDARSPELYQSGHILGALNLPWEDFNDYYKVVMLDLAPGAMIITYCDGESCGLSRELALELMARGYRNVRVLVNGWSLWEAGELPVETGPATPAS